LLEWTMEHTVEEIYRSSQEKGIPVGAVRSADQVLNDIQMMARGFFIEVEHPQIGKLKYPGVPYKLYDFQKETPTAAPQLGQHNVEIYCGRLGYTKREITRLKESGVI